MHTKLLGLMTLLVMTALSTGDGVAYACGDYGDPKLRELAADAMDADLELADFAIGELRKHGPQALRAAEVQLWRAEYRFKKTGKGRDVVARAVRALDKVAGQKDARRARLFWHTDMTAAMARATAENKPILSLRLLGRLDEDLSCANSRFFRTALYANSKVAAQLRSRFVLHWESVRPVPVITIDFGDGRTLCRTITGNSIHYVLDAKGRPVDALPGLYSPAAFQRGLTKAHGFAKALRGVSDEERSQHLAVWHREAAAAIDKRLVGDLAAIGDVGKVARLASARAPAKNDSAEAPSARRAAMVATGKRAAELSTLKAIQPTASDLQPVRGESVWKKLAALPAHAARLDAGSIALMRAKADATPARVASALTVSKARVEDPLLRVIRSFEAAMAVDSVRNEFELHRTLHTWFAANAVRDVTSLNERVYAELFLTPSSDPWLGLAPADAYTALDRGGFVTAKVTTKTTAAR